MTVAPLLAHDVRPWARRQSGSAAVFPAPDAQFDRPSRQCQANPVLSRIRSKSVYVHRPDQIVRRLTVGSQPTIVPLPWGDRLEVDPRESVGSGIARTGVHELAVTEAIWRLAGADDLALDVGANIGYFTMLLAARCRDVWAFEPYPGVGERLARNVAGRPNVTVYDVAVSDREGTANLGLPADFDTNAGTAALTTGDGLEVRTVTIDETLDGEAAGIMKIDIEGHELPALRGAQEALRERRIRDLIFEDHDPWPTPVTELLEKYGYKLYGLREQFRTTDLCSPAEARTAWAAPTFLATVAPARAEALMRPTGWQSLRPRWARTPAGESGASVQPPAADQV
jgi:FkbM family methyltransferase